MKSGNIYCMNDSQNIILILRTDENCTEFESTCDQEKLPPIYDFDEIISIIEIIKTEELERCLQKNATFIGTI